MRRVVVLGMMAKKPVPGVIWQTVHYLLGLRRLGFEPYYVEAHALTPSMLMELPTDDGAERAAALIDRTMRRFDLGNHWAFHALHGDGRCLGLAETELRRLYRESELILNLHGGTLPSPELVDTGRLVLVETDPVRLQIELHDGLESSISFLEAHSAYFTFAENLGRAECGLPVSADFHFQPTRQPVALDLWQHEHAAAIRPVFTTVGNWRQRGRSVSYRGETYDWSKDIEWRKFLDMPARTGATFELALSRSEPGDSQELEERGFRVRDALTFDLDGYRDFITRSLAEFTVAKDQNIRFATGWFSDRGATYLASGRPVINQDTGFGTALPTGEGLFAVSSLDDAAAAVEAVQADPKRHSRKAAEIAREYFDAERVLGDLLARCDVTRRTRRKSAPELDAAEPAPKERHRLGPNSSVLAVIPHYRCEEWLDDCVASLVAQTRPPEGIVVIDDASDDPPLRTVQRYPAVTLLHADRNVGPYRLVQQVIDETDYDAYLFQDADDWSAPERLDLLLRGAEQCGAELIGTQEIRVFCDEPEVVPIPWPLDVHAQFEEKPTAFPLLHPTSLVSRDLVVSLGGFATGLRFSGDAEFLRRARFVSHVANIPDYLYYRRIREGSLTTAPATNLQSPERKRVMEMLWERARRNAELVEGGGKPDLEPCSTAPPVGLAHLAGPTLRRDGQPLQRQAPPPVAARARATEPPGAPVFIVGADRSGISALAWAVAEHRRFEAVPGEWAEDETIAEFAARLEARPGRVVDGSRRSTREIPELAALFPDALFVHIVRDLDSAVSVMTEPPLSAAGATGGTQVPAHLRTKLSEADAVVTWRSATQACIDAEASLGSARVLRVSFDALIETPEAVLRSCLAFAGEEYEAECLRALRRTRARRAIPDARGAMPTSDARAAAAELSRSLLARPEFTEAEKTRIRTLSRTTARDVLGRHVPADAVVAIVSRGDEELLRCAPAGALHVPRDASGRWAGHHPADTSEAIAEIDAAREEGAVFLYVPCTSMWWLDHYDGLRRHLESRHHAVTSSPDEGALFALAPAAGALKPTARPAARPGARERVVLVTDHFPKYSETFFAAEFLGLLERGWDIHVLCNRSNRDQWPYFPELSDHLAGGERIHVIRDFDAQLEELRPALVHFGYGTLARERMHVGHVLGCKVVVSFRGYDINYFGLDDPHCYDAVWTAADVLHLVSEDIWRRAQRRRCPHDKPHLVVTDAVDMRRFTAPERRSEHVGTEDRPLRIVSVGRLHWKKGYEHALSALSALRERGIRFEYRIIGDGPHREAILYALDELDLLGSVELLGARDVTEVHAAMQWADLCLHAAVSEGFCVSVIEAQAMGLPIVCTDADGLAENVADGVTGFVVPRREPGALTSRLAALAADPVLRLRLGKAARERAERLFDLPRQLDGLESLYELALRLPASSEVEPPRADAPLEALEYELAGLERRRDALAKHVRGRQVAARVRSDIDRLLPDGATVLIVSRGDEELLRIGRRDTRHFPQTSDGVYAGHHPADSTAAVEHLESLRRAGANHLVIPATSDWWLDHYADFRQHLEERYVQLFADPDSCVIYALDKALSATGQAA